VGDSNGVDSFDSQRSNEVLASTLPDHNQPSSVDKQDSPKEPPRVTFSQSGGLRDRLAQLDCSVAITSYQSGFLYGLGRDATGGLHLHQSAMPKPMGLAYQGDGRLTLAGGAQIVQFANVLSPHERMNDMFDACFVPRRVHLTGRLDAHDVGIDTDGAPIFVNTRFNCLARPCERHAFQEVWRPPFISDLVDEDRCHLNGMAMRDGAPAFVTAVSRSNTIDGWRDRRDGGGVVINVQRNAVICEGLSMPHSPRWYNGQLWVLNSGTGELGVVERPDPDSGMGRFVPKVFCPGFLRGLSFHKGYAFVGLSKPRYKRFEGLPLDQKLRNADSEPWCGLQIIDLATLTCVDWFRIDGAVSGLYDVAVLPGIKTPMTLGPDAPEAAKLITWDKVHSSDAAAAEPSTPHATPPNAEHLRV